MDSGTIDELTALVDEDRLVRSLSDMVATPSVNPFDDAPSRQHREQEFADGYLRGLGEAGLETFSQQVTPGRPNVFGRRYGSGEGPCVMLAGHLDTVGVDGYLDPFNPVVRDGRLYGRGSCDMKAGMAAYLEVARILDHAGIQLKGDLVIAGVVDEEHLMIGSRHVSEHGPIPDFAIIGEPTELQVCHAHKGQLCLHVRTFGTACHSSTPEQGVNALYHMARVLEAFREYGEELKSRPAHPVLGHPRVNPGVIRGGSISSTVPDFCELEVDRRTLMGETCEDVIAEYRELLDRIQRSDPDFRYEIGAHTLDNGPLDTPPDAEVVTVIADACRTVTGKPPTLGGLSGATDAPNYLCPAVVCGPGSLKQAHTLDEYVSINQLTASARIYLRTVLNMIG